MKTFTVTAKLKPSEYIRLKAFQKSLGERATVEQIILYWMDTQTDLLYLNQNEKVDKYNQEIRNQFEKFEIPEENLEQFLKNYKEW